MNKAAFAIGILLVSALLPQTVSADDALLEKYLTTECILKPEDPENCIGVVGCIGKEGAYFFAQGRGWGTGRLEGATSEGATCEGTFEYRKMVEMAKSTVTCSNDETVDITFFARDSVRVVGQGQGRSSQGRRFEVWGGKDIVAYLLNERPDGEIGLTCGGESVPLQ